MKLLLIASAALYLFGSFQRPLFLAGLAGEVIYLGIRGVELGRLPLIGPHDTLVFFSTSIALMGLPFVYSREGRHDSTLSWGIGTTAALFGLLALTFRASSMPLPPILNTLWFEIHVALAFFAYALFAIGALLGGIYLVRRDLTLLDMQYKSALVGYSFFSASMVSGGIWGYYAWGTYWLWTAKEFWTSILWLFYSLYLHLRLTGQKSDIIVAWAGIIGFAIALFTYLGVSILLKSSHSF
jgi:ABC-type transport system involved in cytochrome c biogenesis permease subunit